MINQIPKPIKATTAVPPTTPPTIAPVGVEDEAAAEVVGPRVGVVGL